MRQLEYTRVAAAALHTQCNCRSSSRSRCRLLRRQRPLLRQPECTRICRPAALPPATPSRVFGNSLHCLTGWPASAPPHSQCWSCCARQSREQQAGLVSRMHTVACTPFRRSVPTPGGGGAAAARATRGWCTGTIPVSVAQSICCSCARRRGTRGAPIASLHAI